MLCQKGAKMKKNRNGLLLAASIFSYISVLVSIAVIFILSFDLFGLATAYAIQMEKMGVYVDTEITFMCINVGLGACIDLYYGNIYIKGYKYRVNNVMYGKRVLWCGVFQLLFASRIAGIIALIAGYKIQNDRAPRPQPEPIEPNVQPTIQTDTPKVNPSVPEYKLKAMSEAITRLKELRAQGAISEEEYYATLDKIIEG